MIVRRLCTGALLFGVLTAAVSWAQAVLPTPSPAPPAAPEVKEDPLGRNTPRGTVRGFLAAEGKGDRLTATSYLNTRLRGDAAIELARQLFVVLNDRLPAKLNEISDKPQGSLYYPNEPDKDLIGIIKSDNGDVEIAVERIENPKLGSIWLFSRITLAEIPELYEEVNSGRPTSALGKFLVETKIARIALMQWLGLFVGLPLLYFLVTRLSRLLSAAAGRLLRSIRQNPGIRNPEILPMPIRLLLMALVIRWALSRFTLPLLARQFWSNIATITFIAGIVWLIIRLTGAIENRVRLRLGRLNLTGALSILRFARSAINGIVMFIALLFLLYRFGFNPTTAIAGLGVGGIAVALAAQKTLENVIAGISLISDKAIRVGDFLKVGDTVGTVNDIGLRSTRIRTLGRTVVNVPNGQIANASLENYSLRDQFWFHQTVCLTYDTTAAQIRSILDILTKLLTERPDLIKSSAWVRFVRFADSSFEIEMFAYAAALDWPAFLKIQQELLLQIMDEIEAVGAKLALPSRKMYLSTSESVAASDGAFERIGDRKRSPKLKSRKEAPQPIQD